MFYFSSSNFKIIMKKNNMTYLHSINFLQLTFRKGTEVKSLGRETPDCFYLLYNQAE